MPIKKTIKMSYISNGMKLLILIPAYNEEKTLAKVIKNLPGKIPGILSYEIIIINDGSTDRTLDIALKMNVTTISHYINRGLGAALGTGFEYARENNFDTLITFDADGQHDPQDIAPVLKPIIHHQADISIGSRLIRPKGIPWYRQIGIFGLNIFTFLFFWVWTTDSQSGLRAFSKNAIGKIKIKSNKMEVSSEFFSEAQIHNLKIAEVPIRSIYTSYSLNKGQKNSNGFKILWRLLYHRFFHKG